MTATGRGLARFGSVAFGGKKMAAAAAAPKEEKEKESRAPAAAPQGKIGREEVLDYVVNQFLQALDAGG